MAWGPLGGLIRPGAPLRRALAGPLRALGLLGLADAASQRLGARAAAADNARWRAAHPGVPTPPDDLVYEVMGQYHLSYYHERGRDQAAALAMLAREHASEPPQRVLDWGCGPARVLAHMPAALSVPPAACAGIDINARAIAWAARAFPAFALHRIDPEPPAPFADGAFDLVYAISVLTHLSPARAERWLGEVRRLLAPRGLAILTTYALDAAAEAELAGGAQVLAGVPEGARAYVARFSADAMRSMCAGRFEVLAHLQDGPADVIGQAVWVLRAAP